MTVDKGYIFDENGERLIINDVQIVVKGMTDRLLVTTYQSTIYQHHLILAMEELVNKGYVKRHEECVIYKKELTENSIKAMKFELIRRFDNKFHETVLKSIDLSFTKKKPKDL